MKLSGRGLTGTLVAHGLLLLLLILGGLTFPVPPPEEEGILVNFGTDDTGFGLIEPEGDETHVGTPEPEVSQSVPEQQQIIPEAVQSDPVPADNTQDIEETVVKEEPQPSAEELAEQRHIEEERRRQEELAEQRRIEEERRRQEELAEQRRIEEEKRKRQEQADRLNRLGENTFGRQGVGDEEGSQGVNPGESTNQGTTAGTPGANNYGEGQGLGDGISFGLGSRKAVGTVPKPNVDNCQVTSRIVVTISIMVDQGGNVVSAELEKATYNDNCILNAVLAAARRTKFSADPNATFRQKGWIRYIIEP